MPLLMDRSMLEKGLTVALRGDRGRCAAGHRRGRSTHRLLGSLMSRPDSEADPAESADGAGGGEAYGAGSADSADGGEAGGDGGAGSAGDEADGADSAGDGGADGGPADGAV